MTNATTTTEKSIKNMTTQKTPQKSSITQPLRTDLGWPAGATTATQLVWLNRLTIPRPCRQPQKLLSKGHTFKNPQILLRALHTC